MGAVLSALCAVMDGVIVIPNRCSRPPSLSVLRPYLVAMPEYSVRQEMVTRGGGGGGFCIELGKLGCLVQMGCRMVQ